MAIKRMTKDDRAETFGVFAPVGHVVVALPDDESADAAARELRDQGFDDADILQYKAREESQDMARRLDGITGTAEFGHEVVLMRQYKEMADRGCGWLVVYAPEKERCEKVVEVARRHGALLAEKYHRLVVEDLL
jgi:tRNA A58 N-methylase Trm61